MRRGQGTLGSSHNVVPAPLSWVLSKFYQKVLLRMRPLQSAQSRDNIALPQYYILHCAN